MHLKYIGVKVLYITNSIVGARKIEGLVDWLYKKRTGTSSASVWYGAGQIMMYDQLYNNAVLYNTQKYLLTCQTSLKTLDDIHP